MPPNVACNLAAAGGMTHVHRILQIERRDQLRQVIGIGIEVVAVPGLTRTPVAAPIVSDASIAALGEIEHLILKRICGQRPAVAEYDRLSAAPIFEINLRAVFGDDGVHVTFLQGPGQVGLQFTAGY